MSPEYQPGAIPGIAQSHFTVDRVEHRVGPVGAEMVTVPGHRISRVCSVLLQSTWMSRVSVPAPPYHAWYQTTPLYGTVALS